MHDQTLRLLNEGYTGIEIAETFQMPPALEKAWHTHGYYGSVSHNVKANGGTFLGGLCFLAGALLLPAGARRNGGPVGPEPRG